MTSDASRFLIVRYYDMKVIDVYSTGSIRYINIPFRTSEYFMKCNGDWRIL